MKLYTNEKAVSEIVGAMFILLIIVLYLGVMQTYEVPKWNKELEKQAFDVVYSDFLNFRMNLEEPSIEMVPRTISMHTGIRYPERFILRNPGQGAYGTVTTYPLGINLSYISNGTEYNENYTSLGFVYEMKGISDNPKLVFEHGVVIKDFGIWNNSEDVNHLTTENGIFIPVIKGIQPIYSKEVETLSVLPVTQYISEPISSMNVTLGTKYPEVWADMPPPSRPPGSQYIVSGEEIRIMNISGFNLRNLSLPVTSSLSQNNIYSGIIRFTDSDTIISTISNSGSCSTSGFYVWDTSQGCMNLPTSASVQKFVLKDIKFTGSIVNKDIVFSVQDTRGFQFKVQLHFDSNANGDPTALTYQQYYPAAGCSPAPQLLNGEVDMTTCYRSSNIGSPNILKIQTVENGLLFAKFHVY